MVSLRIRQRSSSERERARASLPLMSVAPTLVAQGRRMVALAVAAMPSSRPVKPSRSLVVAFTATREIASAGDLGDARAHGVAQRADFRALADQRHIEIARCARRAR